MNAPNEFFVWGNGGARLTPEEVARERELALSLQQPDFSPAGSWMEVIGRGLMGFGGGLRERRANEAADANAKTSADLIASLLGGGSAPASAPAAPGTVGATVPPQAGDMAPYQNAIAGIESGGRYDAVGPMHPELGRALGKYQVMEANVGPWSQAALGRAVTPDEFLANPQIQDQVFNHQFGQYVSKYGPEGAAQAWFAGPGGIGTNRQDSLGTSVPEYAAKFNAALGGQQPVRVASANGADFGPVAQALAQNQPQAQAPSPVAQALAQAPQQQQRPQINPAIMEALTSPYASREAKAIAQSMLQQQMQAQQQANDPRRRLELEKLQLETENLRNPQAPDAVRTLQARAEAAGLVPGTPQYQAFMLSGGAAPVPQVGSIPAGYQLQYDDQGRPVSAVPIPGTPQAMEAEAAARARATTQDRKSTSTDVIGDAAQRARELTGWTTTGMVGSLASNASSSQAAELRRQVDVMKSIATIENLTAMRMASPTGGALGNVTEKEGAMLASATGALDAAASEADFKRALDNYEKTLYRVVHGAEAGDKLFEERRKAAGGQKRTSSGINWSVEP